MKLDTASEKVIDTTPQKSSGLSGFVGTIKNKIKNALFETKVHVEYMKHFIDAMKSEHTFKTNPAKELASNKKTYEGIQRYIKDFEKVLICKDQLFKAVEEKHDTDFATKYITEREKQIEWMQGNVYYVEKAFEKYEKDMSSDELRTAYIQTCNRLSQYILKYIGFIMPYSEVFEK